MRWRSVNRQARCPEREGHARHQRLTVESEAKPVKELINGDSLRTLAHSRAAVKFLDENLLMLKQLTTLEIHIPSADTNELVVYMTGRQARVPGRRPYPRAIRFPNANTNEPIVYVTEGQLRVSSRLPSPQALIETPHSRATPHGTEFLVVVEKDHTEFVMFDGEVEVSNDVDTQTVRSGQQGIVVPGLLIEVHPVLQATNIVQWWIHYPGVLDPDEIGLLPEDQALLEASLNAYRAGDLLSALKAWPGYPTLRPATTDAQRVLLAALHLAVGSVDEAEAQLRKLSQPLSAAIALRTVIAAVSRKDIPSGSRVGIPAIVAASRSASEWLALSYQHQSAHDLKQALRDAREAVAQSPRFGFGWARVAELEFGFGHTRAAREAVEKALRFAPRNAQAHALKGFLLAADNHIKDALRCFNEAIQLDSALGNAWLGRGLCERRLGWFQAHEAGSSPRQEAWLADLQAAAGLEPDRALLRSYLGKGYTEAGDLRLAEKELNYASKLDPADPTPWLYLALLRQEQNRINEAISDLGRSKDLNTNRVLFRSHLLLDQDQAVRSANLASIYRDAGLYDVSLREAARATEYDYANYSAHLFLAQSYDALRDPTRFNLRYETPWFNELLLANLQAPPGVPTISANVSQQEYARLFAHDRLGLTTTSELRTDGQYRERASQYGAVGPFSYSLDLDWQHNEGVRPNNELNRLEWYSQLKYQVTPNDSALALIKYQDYQAGDNFQYYDASFARPDFDYSETQAPMLLAGWHHEWSPGIHTLFLGGRLVNDQKLSDTAAGQIIATVNPPNMIDPRAIPFDVNYQSKFVTYTAELNQVFQRERHTDILGARYQDGHFEAIASLDNPAQTSLPWTLPETSATDTDFQRLSLYTYHHWEIVDGLMLIGGLAYDDLTYPANYRRPPLNNKQSEQSQVSPKGAVLWDITSGLRARTAYAQGVGGVSYDGSVRLEPTQLAGFNQSFRSLISESIVGSVEAPRYELIGGAFDLRPWKNAWLSLQGEVLREKVDQAVGLFHANFLPSTTEQASTSEILNYREFNARAILNQTVGRQWALGAEYQFTRSELEQTRPDIPATPTYQRTIRSEADWHQWGLTATWYDQSGIFARGGFWEILQQLDGSKAGPPGDDFQLLNVFVGYRFPHRRGDLTLGLMNLLNQDYSFSPLNYHPEYPPRTGVLCAPYVESLSCDATGFPYFQETHAEPWRCRRRRATTAAAVEHHFWTGQ